MQRFLSAVVLASVGGLVPAHAAAQSPAPSAPAPASSASAPSGPPGGGEPSPTKPSLAKPSPAKPTPSKSTARETSKAVRADQLSDEAELSRVVGLYEAGKYRECSNEIERLLDPTGRDPLRQPAIVENARVYWAACLLGAGDADASDAPLRAAIHENPQMKPPDNLVFPQPVVDHFLKVRDSLVTEIRAAEQARIKQAQAEARQRQEVLARERERLRQLEKLAGQELVIVQNRRVLSFVPFGVGQIQNRQETLGYTLMASEVLLGGLAITAVGVQVHLAADAETQAKRRLIVDNAQLLSTWGIVKRVSFWGFAGLAVAGVVEAQLTYVPQFQEVRPRRQPLKLSSTPSLPRISSLSWLPYLDAQGGGVDVVGRF
jgi:hypothetical protein